MTTTSTGLPPMRLFTPEECDALVSAGIIAEGEQAAVLSGTRLFNVDECIEMVNVGVLQKEDRVELMDGKLVIMSPIGDSHEFATDWFTMLLASALFGRAMVRIQVPYACTTSAPLNRMLPCCGCAPSATYAPTIPTTFTSYRSSRQLPALRQRPQAGALRRRWHPGGVDRQPAGARGHRIHRPVRLRIRERRHLPSRRQHQPRRFPGRGAGRRRVHASRHSRTRR